MEEFKGRDVAFVSDWLTKRVFKRSLLKTAGADDDCSLVGYDRQIRRSGRAFEQHFGPRGREFERSNLQKFKCPGFAREGGMLKFRVDRRIRSPLNACMTITEPPYDFRLQSRWNCCCIYLQ